MDETLYTSIIVFSGLVLHHKIVCDTCTARGMYVISCAESRANIVLLKCYVVVCVRRSLLIGGLAVLSFSRGELYCSEMS